MNNSYFPGHIFIAALGFIQVDCNSISSLAHASQSPDDNPFFGFVLGKTLCDHQHRFPTTFDGLGDET